MTKEQKRFLDKNPNIKIDQWYNVYIVFNNLDKTIILERDGEFTLIGNNGYYGVISEAKVLQIIKFSNFE